MSNVERIYREFRSFFRQDLKTETDPEMVAALKSCIKRCNYVIEHQRRKARKQEAAT